MRQRIVFRWLRKVSDDTETNFHRLLFVTREERGEIGGREHVHCLIGGLRRKSKDSMFRAMASWTSGFSRIHPFDPRLVGVDYVLKGDSGAAQYEGAKFGAATTGTLSRSASKLLRSLAGPRQHERQSLPATLYKRV